MEVNWNKGAIFAVFFQITLMLGMTFSNSYFIGENFNSYYAIKAERNDSFSNFLGNSLKFLRAMIFNENTFVSAQAVEGGAYTCPLDKNGAVCQEYLASECDSKCSTACLPTTADKTSNCKPGTCYDAGEGTCSVGATKGKCESDGGQWFNDPYGNILQCRPGCCIIGEKTFFESERRCNLDSARTGIKGEFRQEIGTEYQCITLSKSQEEGACLVSSSGENNCKFTTKSNCIQNLKGSFNPGVLCSNPILRTDCQKQQSAKCVEGKDEVYWFDSCGNRENIYDSDKAKSYNDGKILAKSESCTLSSGSGALSNSVSCGNCNYIQGSICGKSTNSIGYSCIDLSCSDENGNKRNHGESWCQYQGSIGVDKDQNRVSDTVGSRSFRKVCLNGEVRTEPCADYRNEICIQSKAKLNNGDMSFAACRINRAYQCYNYNGEKDLALRKAKCEKNPDCFIKSVDVDKGFKFDICAPKYSPGFNLETRSEGVSAICSFASQKCMAVFVKGIGGWDCKANCGCVDGDNPFTAKPSVKFTEQMNNLCTSLGDCGTKSNYIGDLSVNSKIFSSGDKNQRGNIAAFSEQYKNNLRKYADDNLFKGKYIEAPNINDFYRELGIPGTLGSSNYQDPSAAVLQMASTTSGMAGLAVMVVTQGVVFATGSSISTLASPVFSPVAFGPAFAAIGGAISGAAIAVGVLIMLLKYTGVSAGLPPELTYSILASGGAAGAIIGANFAAGSAFIGEAGTLGASGTLFGGFGSSFGALAVAAAAAWIGIAVIVIAIVVLFALGVGKTKKIYYSFECNPWQPINGGDKCSQCGNGGLPCSLYSCQSLGQTCQLINEDTEKAECVNVSPDDVSSPVIKPVTDFLPQGYKTEQNEYGVNIQSNENDGCIKNIYGGIPFGIKLDEAAQCSISYNHTDSYDEMEKTLSQGLYYSNHSLPLVLNSLNQLGLETFNPDARAEFNIYIRCKDKNGNANVREYVANYCVKPGNDSAEPSIVAREPFSEKIKINSNSIQASIFTNEPSECRWDLQDNEYSAMKNNMTCLNDFEQRELFGWRCVSDFPILKNEETFYLRCLDQPWLTDNAGRNAASKSYLLKFTKTASDLKIDSVSVEAKNLTFSIEPASVDVAVKTSGGLDGKAKCSYLSGNTEIEFQSTWSEEHRQVLQAFSGGETNLTIICEDLIGNKAEKSVKFRINIDKDSPEISRVYVKLDALTIITNEESTCYYSKSEIDKCSFDIDKGIAMVNQGKIHFAEYIPGITYYIKCKDIFNHYPGSCNMIVKGGNYGSKA